MTSSPAELFLRRVEDVIWTELERQADEGMGPYVDREMDMVDASGAGLNMTAVAAAVVQALGLTEERRLEVTPTYDSLGDGLSVGYDSVDCHLCEFTSHHPAPREAFDWALKHAKEAHSFVPTYSTRFVTPWAAASQVGEQP